jgi:exportin-2 (importin alpha re-exporter)
LIAQLISDSDVMRPFSQTIFMLLLTRLQSKPSTQFSQSFLYFLCFLCAIDNVGPDFVITTIDAIQPGLFGNILTGVVLSNTQKAPARSRKVIEVGLTKALSKSEAILTETHTQFW